MNKKPTTDLLANLGFEVIGTFEFTGKPSPREDEDVIQMHIRLAREDAEYQRKNYVPGHWIVGHEPI